jgi:hypothetical protein
MIERRVNVMTVLRLSLVIIISHFHKVKQRPLYWLWSHAIWEYKTGAQVKPIRTVLRIIYKKIYLPNGNEKMSVCCEKGNVKTGRYAWGKNTGHWKFSWLSISLREKHGISRKHNCWKWSTTSTKRSILISIVSLHTHSGS